MYRTSSPEAVLSVISHLNIGVTHRTPLFTSREFILLHAFRPPIRLANMKEATSKHLFPKSANNESISFNCSAAVRGFAGDVGGVVGDSR